MKEPNSPSIYVVMSIYKDIQQGKDISFHKWKTLLQFLLTHRNDNTDINSYTSLSEVVTKLKELRFINTMEAVFQTFKKNQQFEAISNESNVNDIRESVVESGGSKSKKSTDGLISDTNNNVGMVQYCTVINLEQSDYSTHSTNNTEKSLSAQNNNSGTSTSYVGVTNINNSELSNKNCTDTSVDNNELDGNNINVDVNNSTEPNVTDISIADVELNGNVPGINSTECESLIRNETNNYPIYIPNFRKLYNDTNKYPCDRYKEIMKDLDWITPQLNNEILDCLPAEGDISLCGSNSRNHDAFAIAAKKLFPIGRIFASPKQLDQVADKFCSKWAVKKIHPGRYIGCFIVKKATTTKY